MGVFIGVVVLLVSIGLVVLMALSEWFDFDLGHSVAGAARAQTKAPSSNKPSRRGAGTKRRRR